MSEQQSPEKGQYFWPFALGGLLIFLSMLRFSVQPFAWVAYTPLLVPLFVRGGWRPHLVLLAVLVAAFHLAVGKIITAPLSFIFVPLYALPLAAAAFATVSLSAAAYRRLGPRWGIYLLPCLAVAFEWLQYTLTELGTWGGLAFTQSQNLSLLQSTTFFGVTGVSFLVALGSSLVAALVVRGVRAHRVDLAVFLALFAGAHFYGELRLAGNFKAETVPVAGLASLFSSEEIQGAIRDPASARPKDALLFERTMSAARRGARLVVWNEVATIMERPDEPGFVEKGRAIARETGIDLVMSYGVLLSRRPFSFENKYLWVRPDGAIADEYWKRHPVPGEGSVPGTKPARIIPLDPARPALGKAGGGICYDMDFPSIPLELVRAGAGLVALPSSDWRGIDPIHSDMARIMGIATGMSVLRSVRSATSMASDPYGRIRASRRFYENGDGVMLADLPAVPVPTLYAKIGDVFPIACALFSLAVVGWLTGTAFGRPPRKQLARMA